MLRSSGRAYLLDGLQHVPADAALVVIAPDRRTPTAYLHGPSVSRPLIYAADVPDAAKLERWQRDGVQYLCVSASMQHRRDIDAALMKLGVRRLAEGVYAIP